jgi:hypothetical protein
MNSINLSFGIPLNACKKCLGFQTLCWGCWGGGWLFSVERCNEIEVCGRWHSIIELGSQSFFLLEINHHHLFITTFLSTKHNHQ